MFDSRIVSVIMAGGRGERFWPASKAGRPKQFLSLTGGPTLFQEAVRRIAPLTPFESIYPVTGRSYLGFLREQAPGIPERNHIIEPIGRDTAACLALAAFTLRGLYPGLDPVMLVLAADHVIADDERFRAILRAGAGMAAKEDCVVVLGIPPTYPATGYGYIRYERQKAARCDGIPVHEGLGFVEKPELETAESYLASGDYLWNSGMFIWRVSYFLRLLAEHLPDHYNSLARVFAGEAGPDPEALQDVFINLERVSVDYGIMEKADRVKVIPAEIGWDDVGSWPAMAPYLPQREGNAVLGGATLIDTRGCVVYCDQGHIGLIGVQDMIVVRVGDDVLVCPKDRAQEVKKIAGVR